MKLKALILAITAIIPFNGIAAACLNPFDLLKAGLETNLSFEQINKIREHIPDFFNKRFSPEHVLKACETAHEFIPRLLAKDLYAELINKTFEKEHAHQKVILYTITGAIVILGSYLVANKVMKYWKTDKAKSKNS